MILYIILGIVISVAILLMQTSVTTTRSMLYFMLIMSIFWPVYLPTFIYDGLRQIELTGRKVNWWVLRYFIVLSIFVLHISLQACIMAFGMSIFKGIVCLLIFLFMLFIYGGTFLKIYQTYKREKE